MSETTTHERVQAAHAVLDAHAGRERSSPAPAEPRARAWTRPLTLWGAAVDRVALEAMHGLFELGDRPDLSAGDVREPAWSPYRQRGQ